MKRMKRVMRYSDWPHCWGVFTRRGKYPNSDIRCTGQQRSMGIIQVMPTNTFDDFNKLIECPIEISLYFGYLYCTLRDDNHI